MTLGQIVLLLLAALVLLLTYWLAISWAEYKARREVPLPGERPMWLERLMQRWRKR